MSDEIFLESDGIKLDLIERTATRDGCSISLSPVEFKLLVHFMTNPNIGFTHSSIAEAIYPGGEPVYDGTINVWVHRLRQKIDRGFKKKLIHTVRKMGYRFGA